MGLKKSVLDFSAHGESGTCPDLPHAIDSFVVDRGGASLHRKNL